MEKSRIAALVDGIFAVAMTLLVLDLKLPEGVKLRDNAEVWYQLRELTGRFSMYALSFIVLASYWVGHHSLFHFVRRVDRVLLWLNLLFLLFITLLPFSTNILAGHSHLQIPVVIYGTNLFFVSMISLLQLRYLAHHPEFTHDQLTTSWIANVRRRMAIQILMVPVSIIVSFYKPALALNVYWLLLVFHFLPGKHHRPPVVEG
jgi:uncharacterized membrane protein